MLVQRTVLMAESTSRGPQSKLFSSRLDDACLLVSLNRCPEDKRQNCGMLLKKQYRYFLSGKLWNAEKEIYFCNTKNKARDILAGQQSTNPATARQKEILDGQ
jgi:hypothetical protein